MEQKLIKVLDQHDVQVSQIIVQGNQIVSDVQQSKESVNLLEALKVVRGRQAQHVSPRCVLRRRGIAVKIRQPFLLAESLGSQPALCLDELVFLPIFLSEQEDGVDNELFVRDVAFKDVLKHLERLSLFKLIFHGLYMVIVPRIAAAFDLLEGTAHLYRDVGLVRLLVAVAAGPLRQGLRSGLCLLYVPISVFIVTGAPHNELWTVS